MSNENIYDKAIKHVDKLWKQTPNEFGIMPDLGNEFMWVVEILKRAKKEHELLDLYRLQQEFKERYQTEVRILHRQKILDTIRELSEEIYLKEKELEEM